MGIDEQYEAWLDTQLDRDAACEGYCDRCRETKDMAEFAYPHLCQDCYEARLQREEVALEDADNFPDGIDEGG